MVAEAAEARADWEQAIGYYHKCMDRAAEADDVEAQVGERFDAT